MLLPAGLGPRAHLAQRLAEVGASHVECRRELAKRGATMVAGRTGAGPRPQRLEGVLDLRGVDSELTRERLGEVCRAVGPVVREALERRLDVGCLHAQLRCELRGEAALVPVRHLVEGGIHLVDRDAERVRQRLREVVTTLALRLVVEVLHGLRELVGVDPERVREVVERRWRTGAEAALGGRSVRAVRLRRSRAAARRAADPVGGGGQAHRARQCKCCRLLWNVHGGERRAAS